MVLNPESAEAWEYDSSDMLVGAVEVGPDGPASKSAAASHNEVEGADDVPPMNDWSTGLCV